MSPAIIASLITLAIVAPVAIMFGILLERDRVVRFPTVADKLPRATATWRQVRAWKRDRLELDVANRWRAP